MAIEVRSPDGRRWTIRRRWVPRLGTERIVAKVRHQLPTKEQSGSDGGSGNALSWVSFAEIDVVAIALLVVVLVLVALVVVLPLLFVVVDLAILAVPPPDPGP